MKKIFFFASIFMLALACKNKNKVDTNTPEMIALPADFNAFYENFHADSVYQLRHTAFPLQGLPQNADSTLIAANNYLFQEKDWLMHHAVDFSQGEFTQSFLQLTDRMITERIFKADNTFGIERRFAKLSGGEWNLIYYVAPNRFTKK